MILRVTIENLVVVDHADFEPGDGLTCVTGETGAGKTLLANAIALLFGAKADAASVGSAADHAWVEGEFEVPPSFWDDPSVRVLGELRPDGEQTLVLARKVSREGRSRSLAWGRSIGRADLQAASRLLVVTASQHAQRRLLSATYQRELLDLTGDAQHAGLVSAMQHAHHQLEAARVHLADARTEASRLAAHADQVLGDLARIDEVSPSLEEEADLLQRRSRARNHAEIFQSLSTALTALADSEHGSAVDTLGQAWSCVDALAGYDDQLAAYAARLLDAQQAVTDVASELRSHVDQLDDAPGSIEQIEQRLGEYDELRRRFGGTTEAVLAAWQQLRDQAGKLADVDGFVRDAELQVERAEQAATELAASLSGSRTMLARALADAVSAELGDLGMGDSVFDVVVEPAAMTATGGDSVAMRSAPSRELEPRPIAQVASGGELSRIALALHVATGACEAGTIIFDEVDAGIGGTTAHAIAEKLHRISRTTQVICITHLPQIAARADTNVVVTKQAGHTNLAPAQGEHEVVDELCRMMGADPADEAARATAAAMRRPRFRRGDSDPPGRTSAPPPAIGQLPLV